MTRYLSISFDDGYLSTFCNVKPILDQHGIKATWGIIVGLIGKTHHKFKCVEWKEINMLRDGGHEIASHSMTHPFLTRHRAPEDELSESQKLLNATTFIYPNGNFDGWVKHIVSKYYKAARASYPLPNDIHELVRFELNSICYNTDECMGKIRKRFTPEMLTEDQWLIECFHIVDHPNWYPWDKEVFEKAKKENKPLFLSMLRSTRRRWLSGWSCSIEAFEKHIEDVLKVKGLFIGTIKEVLKEVGI